MDKKNLLNQLNAEAREHSVRVAKLCKKVAIKLNINAEAMYLAGLYHDIGKVFIPARVLKKAANLTDLEREIIDLHSYFGYRVLKEYDFPEDICMSTLYHHGINKMKLNPVPHPSETQLLMAEIIATVDCFDALTNNRIYRKKDSCEKAFEIISKIPHCSKEALDVLKEIYS